MIPATGSQPQAGVVTRSSVWRISPSERPRLRIGVISHGINLERCYASVLEDIRQSNFARVELLVVGKDGDGRLRTAIDSPRHLLYRLYLRLDQRMRPANHPLEKVDASDLLAGVDKIDIAWTESGFTPRSVIAAIQSKNLDVLLNFSQVKVSGEIVKAARCGVWSYRYGDLEHFSGEPAHFWELYEGSPLSGVVLEAEGADTRPLATLCKSLFTTHPTISVSKNRFAPCWGSTEMVIQSLNRLHQFGCESLVKSSGASIAAQESRRPYSIPRNSEMARWLAPIFLKKALRYPFRQRVVQHWAIATRVNAKPLFAANSKPNLNGFRFIEAPKGHFWADPFGFACEGKNWAFFEEYSYAEKRAWIACAEISADGSLLPSVRCLDTPGRHYSYPYIFRDGTDIFMIPEAYDSESVDLYRCERFPDKWVHVENMLKGKFVDTSVWKDQGLWWMMTTSVDPNPRTPCLFLFYSESLTGSWRFHPANPISTDVRNNRGAGRIFQAHGRWIRPSQSCCPIYGYSFSLNEVAKLSPQEYSERTLLTVTPPDVNKDLCAVHTYNWVGNVELLDGARMLAARHVR